MVGSAMRTSGAIAGAGLTAASVDCAGAGVTLNAGVAWSGSEMSGSLVHAINKAANAIARPVTSSL